MENPEEILHSLEEFAKMKPKDIPKELEDYLKFVAKTGDPVYQWPSIKSLFREKLIKVITEFYETCASMEIPPCPNVEMFNYDLMKGFILEKLDSFASAPFTLQRISELLIDPNQHYTRIDKFMRALEKNILVVSTMEPGGSRRTENGDSIVNGIELEHEQVPEPANEINVEEMDDTPYIQTTVSERMSFDTAQHQIDIEKTVDTFNSEKLSSATSSQEIVCVQYVSIEPISGETTQNLAEEKEANVSVTITAINVIDEPVKEHIEPPAEEVTSDNTANGEALTEGITTPIVETELPKEPAAVPNDHLEIENSSISTEDISNAKLPEQPLEATPEIALKETESISPETSTIVTLPELPTEPDVPDNVVLNTKPFDKSIEDVPEYSEDQNKKTESDTNISCIVASRDVDLEVNDTSPKEEEIKIIQEVLDKEIDTVSEATTKEMSEKETTAQEPVIEEVLGSSESTMDIDPVNVQIDQENAAESTAPVIDTSDNSSDNS